MLTTKEIWEKEKRFNKLFKETDKISDKEKCYILHCCIMDDNEGVYNSIIDTAYNHCNNKVYKIIYELYMEA